MKNLITTVCFLVSVQYALMAQTGIHAYSSYCPQALDVIQVDDGFLVTGRTYCDFMVTIFINGFR